MHRHPLSPTTSGNSRIRRYRVALDMPRSWATRVAGSSDSIRRIALRIWELEKVRRRPPKSLPAALRLTTESVMRFRLISSSIYANAVTTMMTTGRPYQWVISELAWCPKTGHMYSGGTEPFLTLLPTG